MDVLGVHISVVDMDGALACIREWIRHGDRQYVCVTGVHGVMESQADEALRRIHNRSGLTTPDGMPLVWAGRFAGASTIDRVCGPELLPAVSAAAASEGWRFFLYGGGPGVADQLANRLVERFPGLDVVGTYSPPFAPLSAAERAHVIGQINASAADIVWVGLSTPKQERWMADVVGDVYAPVLIGVGAAFDMHAGLRRRAPRWIRRSGFEWMYRAALEPSRLGRRYASVVPRFVFAVLRRPPRLVDRSDDDDGQ